MIISMIWVSGGDDDKNDYEDEEEMINWKEWNN